MERKQRSDQLCSYCEADLSLFWHMENVGFIIYRDMFVTSEKRGRKKIVESIDQELVIKDKPVYVCIKCGRKFNR